MRLISKLSMVATFIVLCTYTKFTMHSPIKSMLSSTRVYFYRTKDKN